MHTWSVEHGATVYLRRVVVLAGHEKVLARLVLDFVVAGAAVLPRVGHVLCKVIAVADDTFGTHGAVVDRRLQEDRSATTERTIAVLSVRILVGDIIPSAKGQRKKEALK